MNAPIIAAILAVASFAIYKIVAIALDKLRHVQNAKRLGCLPAPPMQQFDFWGIRYIYLLMRDLRDKTFVSRFKERMDAVEMREGRPVRTVSLNVLGSPVIFTIDPKNVQTILATQFKDFGLGDARNSNFNPLLGHGIFASDGAQWEHSRALLRPQFARNQISDLELEETHVQNLMRCLTTNASGWTPVVDILPMFFRITLDSATEFLFGESVESQLSQLAGYQSKRRAMGVNEREFSHSFDQAQTIISEASTFVDFYWIKHNAELRKHCNRVHAYIDHYVQLALSKDKSSGIESKANTHQKYVFLDALAESTHDPVELRSELLNILLAGRDTTASLLSYVYKEWTTHPEKYDKLRAIVLETFGTYSNPKEITFEKLKSCKYLQWVMNETLRLYPVVPYNSRRALKDTTLPTGGGPDGKSPIYLRKGQQVDYSVYCMQRQKDLWGPDADEFRPERWDGRRSGWDYLPFNGGPRICIGQQFALTEAGYVLVRLLQRFEKVQGVSNSWDPVAKGGYGYDRSVWKLTANPADGVKVRMKEASE